MIRSIGILLGVFCVGFAMFLASSAARTTIMGYIDTVSLLIVFSGAVFKISSSSSFDNAFATSLSISPWPGTLIIFFISGRSVTVVDPAVWSGFLLKARYVTSVKPLRKNKPPKVTINEAIPLLTIMKPWNQPKERVITKVIKSAVKGETFVISNNFIPSKWKPPSKDT